jgi:TrpR family transcriptional regulator, trp operon repressor
MNNEADSEKTEKTGASEEMLNESFEEICGLLADVNDKQFIYDFFVCLFTPAERKDFANRWLLVKEIQKGTTQREIARKFGMSLCKITRGSRELNKKDSAFMKMLERLPFQKESIK